MSVEYVEFGDETLDVHYNYKHHSGYWMDSNGDGLPDSCDFEIEKIVWDGRDVTNLLYEFSPKSYEDLSQRILEKISR